ncbi:MAG: hypothetical protein KDA51_18755, partial [Planctomycetales bacterium]|nr:hypothetical protein [Planctomycetales bacterium]
MKTKKTKQVSGPTSQAPRLVLSIALVIGFFGYILTFLQQTSLFGFVDAQGQAHNRLVDLLVIPDLMWGVFGDGTDLGLLDRLPILAGAAAWLTIAAWIGWACVSFLSTCSKLQRIVLATLAGLAILSTTMLFLGMAGCLASRWPLVISVGGLMLLSGFLQNRARKRDLSAARQPSLPPDGEQFGVRHLLGADGVLSAFMFRWVQIAACILAALYVLGSALPAWEFDVLEYHLQAPKEFHEAGRIGFVNHNVYANMPLGAEMHTLAAMTLIGGANAVWWGALIGKSIIGSYSLLCAALVGSVVADRLGKLRGWSAAGLLLAVPGSVHVSWAGLIDMVLST